ncbi:MAG: DDE-type integrase/transposase/recombinase [Candidatus Jordarchaeaceae archaeon]
MLCITFERWRAPPEIILFSLKFILWVQDELAGCARPPVWGVGPCGEATRRCASGFKRPNRATRRYFAKPLKRVSRIILDESQLLVRGEWVWLWVALDPARRVVLEVYLSKTRNGLVATSFTKKLMKNTGRKCCL